MHEPPARASLAIAALTQGRPYRWPRALLAAVAVIQLLALAAHAASWDRLELTPPVTLSRASAAVPEHRTAPRPSTVRETAQGAARQDAGPARWQRPDPALQPVAAYHVVNAASGDTLSGIADRFHVALDTLVAANPKLEDPDRLSVGQAVVVPMADGVLYAWQAGDTPESVARRAGIALGALLDAPGNQPLAAGRVPRPGEVVLLAGVRAPARTRPHSTALSTATPVGQDASGWVRPVPGSVFGTLFGRVDALHPRGHHGVDLRAGYGDTVRAAASGVVIAAAYDSSWGEYVEIQHAPGLSTLYAHLSAFVVGKGQRVSAGQPIGRVGCTGWCFGPHLHFEVHREGRPINPLPYLP